MSADNETTRIVRSWLEDGVTQLPDSILDAVLDELPTTSQRRVTRWPARRLYEMNNTAKVALGAAAVVVAAVLGIGLVFSGGPRIGAPQPTVVPPTPLALRADDTELDAGTYVTSPFGTTPRFTMTLPSGWRAFTEFAFLPVGEGSSDAPDGMSFGFFQVRALYSDPCDSAGSGDIDVGSTVDDLANAFADQSAYEVASITDVTLAGYAGKRVDLELPSDLDPTSCGYEDYVLWPGSPYAQGPGNLWHVWILDVEGTRHVVVTNDFEGTPAEDRAEMQDILDSLRIDP